MMKKTCFGPTAAILVSLAALLAGCTDKQGSPSLPSQGDEAGLAGASGEGAGGAPAYPGEVVAWVDGYAVRTGELESFAARHLGEAHSDPHKSEGQGQREFDFSSVFDAWLRHHLLVKEAEARGLGRDPAVRKWERWSILISRFEDYRRHLYDNAEISADRLNLALPKTWVRMNFALRVFPTEKEAWEARKRISSREDFLRLPAGFSSPSGSPNGPETGLIWQESGFFKKVDEGLLFKLKEGEISDPVESGLGAALCMALERQDFSEEDKAAYLSEVRARLSEDYVNATLQKVAKEGPFKVHEDRIEKAWAEGRGPTGEQVEFTALEFMGEDISFRAAMKLRPANLNWMRRVVPRERWGQFVATNVRELGERLSWGAKGEELGLPVSPAVVLRILEWKKDFLYDLFQEMVAAEAVPKEIDEGELKKFYDENTERFVRKDALWMDYYFSPFIDDLEPLYSKHTVDKVPFDELGKFLRKSGTRPPHQTADSSPLKTKAIFRGDPGLPGVKEDLFRFDVGHVGIFKTGLGEYLVLIKDRRNGETLPFEQAKTAARNLMQRTIQERTISDLVANLRKKTNIVFSPDGEEKKGEPGKGTADFT